jgi:hypothetical protein
VRDSQERWLRERAYLNLHRYELTRAAQDLYPPSWPVAGTPLLARPGWLPTTPIPLDQVTLSWRSGSHRRGVDGTEPASAPVRPLGEDGTRFDCYAHALGVLSRPGLFENRACYRLLDVPTSPAAANLAFGQGSYFDVINVCEATAHEYAAAAVASGNPARPPTTQDLPLRSLIGDPTDLQRRPVMAAISTLILRVDSASGDVRMMLHWRDPAKVASGGGLYQVVPVGMFQPSHDASWNQGNDFSLWRSITRELSEELLGADENYHSDTAPIDYERWPFYAALATARRAGTLQVYWLGLGTDPLTLVTDLLVVVVVDGALFDQTFTSLVSANDEGRILSSKGPAGATIGIPFTASSIEHFTTAEPMQPAGAALLRTAWKHRDTLLAKPSS